MNTCPVDSNFCKNQALRAVVYHRLALSVDVLPVLQMFTELDGAFDPGRLIFNPNLRQGMTTHSLKSRRV